MQQDNQSSRTKRVAKNTFLLYIRMFLVLIVSLFTSRLILKQLGVTDFGIYSVVGGIVVIFNVLSASFSESTSRFYAFCIGCNDSEALTKQYRASQSLHWILGLIIFILAAVLGTLLIDYKLNIPNSRLEAARYVLIFSSIAFGLRLTNVPYRAMVIAYERMNFFAVFGIFEVLFKLMNVCLLYFIKYDHLIVFSFLSVLEPLINNIVLKAYCKKQFEVCKGKMFGIDMPTIKKMGAFAGWDMLGAVERILQDQGINIVINCFCLPFVNAGRAVAMQVKNAITQFTGNFQTAVAPQITKSYAEGNYKQLHFFILKTSKFSFFLLLLLISPIFVNSNYILRLWLGEVPSYANIFVRYSLILILSDAFYEIMNLGAKATGKLKKYRIYTSVVSLINVPLAYFLMSSGMRPEYTVLQISIINVLILAVQLYLLHQLINLSYKTFIKEVLCPCYVIGAIVLGLSVNLESIFSAQSISWLIINSIAVFSFTILIIVLFGLTKNERLFLFNFLKSKL